MLRHTRVSQSLDTSRGASALRTPGMDPRPWISLAAVTARSFDDTHGWIVDVSLMPSGIMSSARVGSPYSGPGFGLHCPIDVDDEVLVEAPDGDPGHGLVVTARLHSPSDPPSQAAIDNQDDVVLVVKPEQSLRLVVSEGGGVSIGIELAVEQVPLGTTYRAAEDLRFAGMDAYALALGVGFTLLNAAVPTLTGPMPAITAWNTFIQNITTPNGSIFIALQTAISAFAAGEAGYLSNTVKVAP